MKIMLTINGLETEAHYSDREIETLHKPLLQHFAKIASRNSPTRTIIFLSAPPGTGKSTLTTFWEYLSRNLPDIPQIQTLPMDGFHHYNSWLQEQGLRASKGAPETFNVEKLAENLQKLREAEVSWPQYDRKLHDPVEAAIQVTAPIVIVEGNWLLLDDPRWRALGKACDFSLFIDAPAHTLEQRLVNRKIAGGLTAEEAEAFYRRTDGPNVDRVLNHSREADLRLHMDEQGGYHLANAPEQLKVSGAD